MKSELLTQEEFEYYDTRYVPRCGDVAIYADYLFYCVRDKGHEGNHKCLAYKQTDRRKK